MARSTCRACDAPITWAVNDGTGKAIPLDAEPVPAGNIVDTGQRLADGRLLMRILKGAEEAPAGATRYVSHFATCTDPERFRRPR